MFSLEEYKAVHPEGYGYSRFCEAYRCFANTLQPVMRQVHKAGEKLFVDFVAVLGASNYT